MSSFFRLRAISDARRELFVVSHIAVLQRTISTIRRVNCTLALQSTKCNQPPHCIHRELLPIPSTCWWPSLASCARPHQQTVNYVPMPAIFGRCLCDSSWETKFCVCEAYKSTLNRRMYYIDRRHVLIALRQRKRRTEVDENLVLFICSLCGEVNCKTLKNDLKTKQKSDCLVHSLKSSTFLTWVI